MRRFAGMLLVGSLSSGQSFTLHLRVTDEGGRPVTARVRLASDQGLQGSGLTPVHRNFPALGVAVAGAAALTVPVGAKTLLVERGPEYSPVELPVEVASGEVIHRTVRLERWSHLAQEGWWSGDMHVHSPPGDLAVLMEAADLHFAPAIICFNDSLTVSPWPAVTSTRHPSGRTYTIDNCEDERPWGAAIFVGVGSPMSLYPRAAQYPPPVRSWAEARLRGAHIDLEKLIWWEAPVMAALNPPDSIGVAVNHFLEDTVSTRASLSRPRD